MGSSGMFGKKKGDEPTLAPDEEGGHQPADSEYGSDISAPPLKPFSRKGSHAPSKPPSRTGFHPDVPARPTIPGPGSATPPPRRAGQQNHRTGDGNDSKRLLVGRDIWLKGEIKSCDRLIVEGRVEVTLTDARKLEISQSGVFKGRAEVLEADISGRFEGDLVASERLTVRNGGQARGSIRYGSIVIEGGGQVTGDMQHLEAAAADPAPAAGSDETGAKAEADADAG